MGFVRISGYPMDLALNEGHSFPGEVTKYPVEVGADVSDHIRDLPPEITLECIVSDIVPGELVNDPARAQVIEGPDGVLQAVLPREEALAKLREIKALRKPVTVETSLGKFESMAFTSLEVPVDAKKNNALFFTAKFSKFNRVTNKRTRTRVRTTMPNGAKAQAVPPSPFKIVRRIKWFHGTPPGTPWKFGNPVEVVTVAAQSSKGVPSNQVFGFVDEALRYEELGYQNGTLQFEDALGVAIVGDRRNALRLDLLRDRQAIDAQRASGESVGVALSPDGKVLPAQQKNVPKGINTSRIIVPTHPEATETPIGISNLVRNLPPGVTGLGGG